MKLAHISDLHLGIDLGPYSLMEDQEFILTKIINVVDEQNVDGVLIAGDVYDKGIASLEAIRLLEKFLKRLVAKGKKVYLISGNHDSAERLVFGRDFMESCGVYFSRVYDGKIQPVTVEDEFGPVNIYLLPFVKPSLVRFYNPEETIESFEDAIKFTVKDMNLDKSQRNICVAHQNIVNAEHCDSELPVYGGLDGINVEVFEDFDYTALGHIHGPQTLGKGKKVRYCGTPLKYSLSEKNHKKSVTIIDLKEKGNMEISTVPLVPLRDVREEKGTFDEIFNRAKEADLKGDASRDDFVAVTLSDEDEVTEAYAKLKTVMPHILHLVYDNTRTRNNKSISELKDTKLESPLELFDMFYEDRNGLPMSDEQKKFVSDLIEEIWGAE